MNAPPILIAISGTDGAGKSTLLKLIKQDLCGKGKNIQIIDKWDILNQNLHPECSFINPDLESLKIRISEMKGFPRALFLLWSIGIVMNSLNNSQADIVLLDGYWMKHAAAEIVLGSPPDTIQSIVRNFPVPDLTLYLDINAELALKRKRGNLTPYECGCDSTLSEENFLRHQKRIGYILREWVNAKGWVLLHADNEPELLKALVLENIESFIQSKL